MANSNRRSTMWFWVLLLLLVGAVAYGVRAASTADKCATGQSQTWKWFEARWECGP